MAGRPFLFYLVNYLRRQGITEFIFSLGHLNQLVVQYLYEDFATLDYKLSIEDEPLGTGGAIRQAMEFVTGKNVLVVNGDTLFEIDLASMTDLHDSKNAVCTLGLKPMKKFDRYGAVVLNEDQSVTSFGEKKFHEEGLINGGVYLLKKELFSRFPLPPKFSFEKEFLEEQQSGVYGYKEDGYFIDIGIPTDYLRADRELKRPMLQLDTIDNSWTLFLDRDGVINFEKKDGYILNTDEFIFYPGVLESFPRLAQVFGKIIVVTNQRGVGRGLMTETNLSNVHEKMLSGLTEAGGRIDKIYYCTSIDNKHPDRKPNPGMAFQAMLDHPGLLPGKSIVAGNKLTDMKFGRHAGLYTVYIRTTHPEQPIPHPDIDLAFDSLPDFVKAL